MNPKATIPKILSSPAVKRFRTLEQARMTRFRLAGKKVLQSVHEVDKTAKNLVLEDLTDFSEAIRDAIKDVADELKEESESSSL